MSFSEKTNILGQLLFCFTCCSGYSYSQNMFIQPQNVWHTQIKDKRRIIVTYLDYNAHLSTTELELIDMLPASRQLKCSA